MAVNEIIPLVTVIVTGSVPAGNGPGSKELLNHIYLPAGIAVALKLDVSDVLIVQVPVGAGLTVITTFCMLVQLLAVNVYAYTTLTGELVVLISVSVTNPVPFAATLLIPVTVARLQEKVVPEVVLAAL